MARERGSGAIARMTACSGALTWQLAQKSRAWQVAQLADPARARAPWAPPANPAAR
jgi:hypothetical protein